MKSKLGELIDAGALDILDLDEKQIEQLFGFKPPRNISNVRDLIDDIARQKPDLWRYFYPRFYQATDRYVSAKLPAQCFFMCALDVLGITHTEPSRTETAMMAVATRLARHKFPHFFVAPELFKAISLSEPPPGMRWDELDLPFDAAIFMLPRHTLIHPVNGEVGWLAYARYKADDSFTLKAGPYRWERISGNHAFVVVWDCHEFRPNPPAFHVALSAKDNPYLSTADINRCFDVAAGATLGDDTWLNIPMAPDEDQFSSMATSLVFRLLLTMDAKPQLVEHGTYTGKRLRGAHQPEVWSPNVLGRSYAIRHPGPGSGGGWTLRMHWRRGHYRQQPYGPKHELRKVVWIEPYLAGAQ